MKRIPLLLVALAATLWASAQNPTHKIEGQTLGSDNAAVGYASVILSPAGEEYSPTRPNHSATVTDIEGKFTLSAQAGTYTLTISCVGYKEWSQKIDVSGDIHLGTITLEEDAQLIESIAITGELIRREADRFVMNNIAQSPVARGRDSYEFLRLAPGVWADDSGSISINGKSGVKVLINEREVRMSADQLMSYLKALPAENLQKIEIIPQSGADYDANSASGVIKITLKRLRESGTSGAVTLGGNFSTITPSYTIGPNGSINHKSGRWNLYGNFSVSNYSATAGDSGIVMTEQTNYTNGASLTSSSMSEESKTQGGVTAGVIYDLSERSSLGVEYNLWHSPQKPSLTRSTLNYTLGDYSEAHTSLYEQLESNTNQSATINYIRTLDDKGSNLKIIADWAQNSPKGINNNSNQRVITKGGISAAPVDSLYSNTSEANYAYYTLTAAVEKKLSESATLSYGAKYTLTDTYSTTNYSYLKGSEWVPLESYGNLTDYNEHIAALYGIYATRFGSGTSLSAGLRAEMTSIPKLEQKYVSLFPNLSISHPLNQHQSVILAASYKRGIRRPSFWQMNPVRTQISEFSYQVGNPDLKPVYSNEISLSAILFYRYTITLGGYLQDGIISQLSMVDDADPTGRTLKYLHTNLNNLYQYYIQISAPAQLKPWWTLNANLLGVMLDQRITLAEANNRTYTLQGSLLNTFTLPKNWSIDLSGHFTTDATIGNLTQRGAGNISLAIKKSCLDKRLTIGAGLNNILNTSHQWVYSSGEGFDKTLFSPNLFTRSINIYVRYNFQSGKMFRARNVESGAADEKSRMN